MLRLATLLFAGAFLCLLRIEDVVVVAFSIVDKHIPLPTTSFDLTPTPGIEFQTTVPCRHRTTRNKRRNEHPPLYSSSSSKRRTTGEYDNHPDNLDMDYDDDVVVPDKKQYSSSQKRDNNKSNLKQVTRTRRRTQPENTIDDNFYDDEDEDEENFREEDDFESDDENEMMDAKNDLRQTTSSSRRRPEHHQLDEYDERYLDEQEYYDDDQLEEDESDVNSGGNFWSNPMGGMDRPPRGFLKRDLNRPRLVDVPRRQRPQREYDGRPDYYVNDSRRTPRRGPAWRSPVRVGAPPPNPFIERLYDRVFFYGFDMDDDSPGVGDKTVFGGTKGKFNGLKYLAISQGNDPANNKKKSNAKTDRGLPPARNEANDKDYYEDDDQEEDTWSEDFYPSTSVRNRYQRRMDRGRRSSGGARRTSYDDEEDFDNANGRGRGDWVSEQVSMWFTDADSDESNNGNNYADDRDEESVPMDRYTQRRRRRGRQPSDWTPLGMLDSFFRMDREQMSFKAAEYDSKMGVRRPRSRTRKETSQQGPKPQRPGFAYRYDASFHDDDSQTVVDIHATEEIEDDPATEQRADSFPTTDSNNAANNPRERSKKSELTWEERQAAVERVPPAEVPAWGPQGELPINARQKAIEDALQDIQTAKRKLNERVKREIRARDEVAILNVDAKALRLKIDQSRRSTMLDMERLQKIELEIDEASRTLRRARKRVDMARDELEELEDRHYAVLSYYNPDQASKLIGEALTEFSDQIGSTNSVSAQVDVSRSQDDS
jgi:hypothetical protein